MKLMTRFAIALVLVIIVITGLGSTAVSTSYALSGDLFYPLKTSAQNARLMLTWDAQARQAFARHFQEEYRNEVRALMQNCRQVQVLFVGTLDALNNNLWVVGGLPVSIDPATMISENPQLGEMVVVEAHVQKDGSILASRIGLDSAGNHHGSLQTPPVHPPIRTVEPEHQQNHQGQDSPTATFSPIHTQEHPSERTGTPSPTTVPVQPTVSVHHDDRNTCQNCGDSPDAHDGDHDGGKKQGWVYFFKN
jgi:hypothetical protein